MIAIDLFAGLGGFTEGATQAGLNVVWAANHWPEAVAAHRQNHPEVEHACQDLHQVDWRVVPKHDVLLASPACQGHSRARQADLPYHDALRSTAWAVVSCLEVHRAKLAVVENIPEFAKWQLFPFWKGAIESLGYHVTAQVLDASDFGVPQARKRLFVVASKKAPVELTAPGLQKVGMRNFIDWDAPNWRDISECKSRLVFNQYENGLAKWGDRFLIGYHSDKRYGVTLDAPMGTITTKDQWAVVDGRRYRMFNVGEYRRAMGFPEDYLVPDRKVDAVKMLGNAVPPPVVKAVITQAAERGL